MQKKVLKQHTLFFLALAFIIFSGTIPVRRNAIVFAPPSSSSLYISNELRSYCTPLIIVCCYPVSHSSVHFRQEIEDHQQKNDNQ